MQLQGNIKYKIGVLPPCSWKAPVTPTFLTTIMDWVKDPRTKKGYVDCKHRTLAAGLKEFRALNDVREYFITYHDQNANWKDDSVEIFYRT